MLSKILSYVIIYIPSWGVKITTENAIIWIKLKVITIKNLSFIIIITGYLLFILSMIEGFLGHLLCWGQMSYWGND